MERRRAGWLKRPWFWVCALVLLGGVAALALSDTVRYVAGMTVVAFTYGITTAGDVDKAAALEKAVTSKITAIHHFVRSSAAQPDRPPIAVTPGSEAIFTQPPEITVYEITDRTEQAKVIAAVQAVVRDQKLKRVDLQFMDHENWIVTNYPNTGIGKIASEGKRGPELQLRRVRISQDNFKEEGGGKTITYLPKELE
jgi:hypothetical protein